MRISAHDNGTGQNIAFFRQQLMTDAFA